ncbi:MAG: ParB N-terminal domain-containing protein [Candidatus Bathyarchaeia archaeon]
MASKNNRVPIKFRIRLVNISDLKSHESTDSVRLKSLKEEIYSDGVLKRPIVIDDKTKIIIDGHHRVEALRLLGCTRIPACCVDYTCDKIGLKSNLKNIEITKDKVMEAALNGCLFNPKSTWHYIKLGNNIRHISYIQRRVDMPLKSLK